MAGSAVRAAAGTDFDRAWSERTCRFPRNSVQRSKLHTPPVPTGPLWQGQLDCAAPSTAGVPVPALNPKQSMTILNSPLVRCALGATLLLSAPALFAEALLKPLPAPEVAKLSADVVKDVVAARAEFDKARVGLVGDELAGAYARMGAVYARIGFNEGAAIAFYDASQLSPKDSRWIYLRGVIARAQKLDADARADYEAALALDEIYLPIRYRLAETLVDMGDLDGAHKLLQAALPAHKDQAALLAMLGRIELHQKRYAEAIGNLEAALKLEPQANALRQNLADAYTGQGNAQQAKDV